MQRIDAIVILVANRWFTLLLENIELLEKKSKRTGYLQIDLYGDVMHILNSKVRGVFFQGRCLRFDSGGDHTLLGDQQQRQSQGHRQQQTIRASRSPRNMRVRHTHSTPLTQFKPVVCIRIINRLGGVEILRFSLISGCNTHTRAQRFSDATY